MMRKIGSVVTLVLLGTVAACTGGLVAEPAGAQGTQLVAQGSLPSATTSCSAGLIHPPVCCNGSECYRWIDDPYRPCEFGFSPVNDGGRCCDGSGKVCGPALLPPPA